MYQHRSSVRPATSRTPFARLRFPITIAAIAFASALASACASPASDRPADSNASRTATSPSATASADSAFAAVQARGADARGMGVDQYTSVHRFDALPDGGRIELQRAVNDSAGVVTIRHHLRTIAAAFETGDFSTPAFVHMQDVPGTRVMAAKRDAITYTYRELPRGGEVRITTRDPAAVDAVHAFIAFQRTDHRAAGADHRGH